jgi:hypothetical protein
MGPSRPLAASHPSWRLTKPRSGEVARPGSTVPASRSVRDPAAANRGSRKPGQPQTGAAENPTASKPVGADPAEGQPGGIYRDFSGFLPFLPEAAWGGWPVLAPILGPTPFLKCDDFRDRSGELH